MTSAQTQGSQGGRQRRLGEFVLLEEIGRGGMGVVYRARQESLGRIVALKTLPSFAGMDRDAVARFRREAESAARIVHRGIVPVYAVGEDQGVYFYAMELVDGPSLGTILAELAGRNPSRLLGTLAEETSLGERCPGFRAGRWDLAPTGARYAVSCAAIAAELASALVVAHHAKIIHRDLKPSNVLLRKDGRPMIVDFGLSRDQTAVGLTQSGDAVGTPSYMAPEQAMGSRDLDARVDVYGLGAALYEMLALRPPFDGAHAAEIMRRIVAEEPPAVRSLNGRVPVDLATIVHQCLAKDRDARYPGMEGVEHDLRAFLEGRPIAAQAPSMWSRGAAFATRHRRGIGVAAATTCVLSLGGVVVGFWSSTRARDDGLDLLATAREDLLERGSIEQAQESYGRANQLLHDPRVVAAARAQHLEAAFARFYGAADKREWLGRLLETVPAEARDPAWLALQRRLRGEGRCELTEHLLDGETTLGLCQFQQGRFAVVPGGWPQGGLLEAGHYLVRAERVGLATAAVAFRVERDTTVAIRVPQLNVADLRVGEALIADGAAAGTVFALSCTELSGAEATRLLAGLPPLQRAEFAGIDCKDDDYPVRNLTFRQARTLAALALGHLPTADEFALAARASAPPAAMAFPWGATFAGERVCADPVRSSHPDPVASRPEGASPFGVLHLAGNVSEPLSVGADGAVRFAGGDYLSQPEQVRIDAAETLASLDVPVPRGGVRVARFVHPVREADAATAAATSARLEALWKEGNAVILNDWDIDESGAARTRLRYAAMLLSAEKEIDIPLSTPGFLQEATPSFRLGDREVAPRRRVALDGEHSVFTVATGGLAGRQLFRVDITAALTALSGLIGQADSYVLQIPLKATGSSPSCYRVTLPRGSRVDEVDPPPTGQFQHDGRPALVWEFGADSLGVRTFSGVVRFRQDGFLTRQWPTKDESLAVASDLFGALHTKDVERLRSMLAPTFLLMPSNLGAEQMVQAARPTREHFDDVRFVDTTAVGPVVTTDLIVDWKVADRAGERATKDWPLRVHWRRGAGGVQILQVAPAARGDTGRLADGVYLHERLLVRVEPGPDFTLSRTVGHLASLQVELRPVRPLAPAGEHGQRGCSVMLLGTFDETDSGEAAMWQRLSDGVHCVGGESRQLDAGQDRLGDRTVLREDWQFTTGAGCTRERWFKVHAGRRWLLLRAVAIGATPAAAAAQWNAAGAWFSKVLAHVQID